METKRISVIQKNPNPLFKLWLREWIDDAEKKKRKISKTYQKALDSLNKYPLTLLSGHDCAILENFGPKICQMLDEKLEKYLIEQPDLGQSCHKDRISELQRREALKYSDLVSCIEAACLTDYSYAPVEPPLENLSRIDEDFEMEDLSIPHSFALVNDVPVSIEIDDDSEQENVEPDVEIPEDLLSQPENSEDSEDSLDRLLKKYDPVAAEQRKDEKIKGATQKTQNIIKRQKLPRKDIQVIVISQSPPPTSKRIFESPISTTTRGSKLKKFKTFDSGRMAGPSYASSPISNFLNVETSTRQLALSPVILLDDDEDEFDRLAKKYDPSLIKSKKPVSPNKVARTASTNKNVQSSSPARSLKPSSPIKLTRKPSSSNLKTNMKETQSTLATQVIPEEADDEVKYIFVDDINPQDFNILLLVDFQETSGKSKSSSEELISKLNESNVMHDVRKLHVGDFLWVAQHKIEKTKELVLPYIIERKRLDDFSSSIKDGRFHEQKFRLKQCGIENVIYLVESYSKGGKMESHGLPFTTLLQAATNTQIHSKFQVKFTENNQHTILYLTVMTSFIENIFKNRAPMKFQMMEFEKFNQSAVKQRKCTVRETFIKQLLSLKGLSVDIALEITKFYATPTALYEKYLNVSKAEGENLLTKITIGDLKRKIQAPVSKSIYQFYMREKL